MNNIFIVEGISKKKNIKLNKNASLDSTSSSLRVKKIKLQNELSPLIKATPNKKSILDFPICMSLFTSNYSLSEKEAKLKLNSSNKLNLNCPSFNNNKLKNFKQNELFLPKTKKIISRNINGQYLSSLSPINSFIKSSILNINRFPVHSSRNLSKPLLKKINYSPLNKLSQPMNKDIRIIKKYKYNLKNFSISNNTLEQEISVIKNTKNGSVSNLNSINPKENKKNKFPYQLISPRDNGVQNGKIFPTTRIINEITKINKELYNGQLIRSSTNQNNKINFKEIKKRDSKLEDITENIILKKNILLNKKKNELNETSDSKKIFNKKNKNKNFEGVKFKFNENNKEKNDKKNSYFNGIFHRSTNKKKTLAVHSKLNAENNENARYPIHLMLEREKLEKIKKNKFYLTVINKKINDTYNKNDFLNKMNERTITNRLNTKIFLQKTEMLINDKESIGKIIIKEEKRLKKYDSLLIYKKDLSVYIQDIYKSKIKVNQYREIILSLNKKIFNIHFNCNLCYPLRNYIHSTTEFGEVSLSNIPKRIIRKRGSAMDLRRFRNIHSLKRQNTFLSTNKISIKNDLDDGFEIKKTKNNFKKDLKWRNNPANLITIHNYILKSLPFNHVTIYRYKLNNKKNTNKKNKFNYKSFSRNASKKIGGINVIGINSSKKLLCSLQNKNTLNMSQNESEISFNKKIFRKGASIKFEELKKTLKKQLSQNSSDSNPENLSVLKQKNFFKKRKNIQNTIHGHSKKDLIEQHKNTKTLNENDEIENQVNLEDIYFELIKLLIEGKNKAFQTYFKKNKYYIDINQELFDGNTLLILSAREGNYYITKFLCEEKAEVNMQNFNGNTALHFAIGKQFYAIADILARYGATEDIKNNKGLAPWDCIENNIE